MKRLIIPAALSVSLLTSCDPDPEPEPHEHEICFCDTSAPRADAGPNAPDSGCVPPAERVCETV